MKIAITGGTGFVGRALIERLANNGNTLRCWKRPTSELTPLGDFAEQVEWQEGELGSANSARELVSGCDAVVHSAFWRPGRSFRGSEGDLVEFTRVNLLGSLQLIEAAVDQEVDRFVFVSTCAVHEKILDDRPLDEAHPLWPLSHYGAHKAAIEKFVHSYGFGTGFPICAIRPTGIYGVHHPEESSKWYELVKNIAHGTDVTVAGGGKEVHVSDVAKGIELLLTTQANLAGEAFACYDHYVSQHQVATIAKQICGSRSEIIGEPSQPRHQIDTSKIRQLGMTFGGTSLLETTIKNLVSCIEKVGA